MIASMGLLAAVLTAATPADSPRQAEAGPRIAYRFQTVAVEGLSWRDVGLKPVAQHGSISVWTAPDDFLDRVAGSASKVDEATEAEGPAGAPVHVSARTPRDFVTRVVWRGKSKAPRRVVEQVREGLTATVAGRRIDQGVLARIVVEDVDVRAVHVRAVASGPSALKPAVVTTKRGEGGSVTVTVTAAMNGEADADPPAAPAAPADESSECKTQEGAVQIPEVGRAAAAGEWLIPEGEVLIVGFGPHTVADEAGRAVVRERLAVIAAEAGDDEPAASNLTAVEIPAPIVPPSAPAPTPTPASARGDAPRIATDLPELPNRTLPQPVHPDGTPAPEPTVPEDAAHAAEAAGESTQPLPTPQTRGKKLLPKAAEAAPPPPAAAPSAPEKSEAPKVEPDVIKSSFTLPTLQRVGGLDSLGRLISFRSLGGPFRGLEFLLPLKPLAVKLPLQHKLEFELIGRVVPDRSNDDDRIVVRD